MGLLSWIGEKISDARDWVRDRIDDVKYFFSSLGSSSSYSGSVEETIDIEQVLNELKEEYAPQAQELEKEQIAEVMGKFDIFAKEYRADYPELVANLENQKADVRRELKNVIVDEFNKKFSINNDKFKKILEMKPGKDKENAVEQSFMDFTEEAVALFGDQLQKSMDALYNDVSVRFEEALRREGENLDKQTKELEQLKSQAAEGKLNLEELEQRCIPVADACECVNKLFNEVEKI